MKTMNELATTPQINEELMQSYDNVIAYLQEAKTKQTPIDEGLFSAVFGGIAGAAIGPAIMKTICKVLGVNEKGPFGTLLTSKLVLSALGAEIGWKN